MHDLSTGRRRKLAEAVARRGLVPWLRGLHDRGRKGALVLGYHRIVPLPDREKYPLDLNLVSATPADFRAQMEFLAEKRSVVSLDDVLRASCGEIDLPAGAVAITFDDGFPDVCEHALPVLSELRLPATVFVTTGYVDSGRPYWFEVIAHLMHHVAPGAVSLPELDGRLPKRSDRTSRQRATSVLQRLLHRLPDSRRREILDRWHQQHSDLLTDPEFVCNARSLTWTEVIELAQAGVTIGSHTVTHPNLAGVSDSALRCELLGSRRRLEERLGRPVGAVAYPFGTPGTYDARVIEAARDAGYTVGVTYRQGTNWLGSMAPLELKRLDVNLANNLETFKTTIALPGWFNLL